MFIGVLKLSEVEASTSSGVEMLMFSHFPYPTGMFNENRRA
jgi:hypothetical protein